jgi:hypothetical protein
MRGQVRAQEREIAKLQRADIPTASAELLLVRIGANDLCGQREDLCPQIDHAKVCPPAPGI